jgi:hypothetical protein
MNAKEFLESYNIWVDQPDVYDHGTVLREIGLITLLEEYHKAKLKEDLIKFIEHLIKVGVIESLCPKCGCNKFADVDDEYWCLNVNCKHEWVK